MRQRENFDRYGTEGVQLDILGGRATELGYRFSGLFSRIHLSSEFIGQGNVLSDCQFELLALRVDLEVREALDRKKSEIWKKTGHLLAVYITLYYSPMPRRLSSLSGLRFIQKHLNLTQEASHFVVYSLIPTPSMHVRSGIHSLICCSKLSLYKPRNFSRSIYF